MSKRDWRFVNKPLVNVYNYTENYFKANKATLPTKRKVIARLLFGEWLKIHRKGGSSLTAEGHTYVGFRGGVGWIPNDSFGTKRMLEIYFIDVGQGDAILIQTPGDNRYLIDGGPTKYEGKLANEFLKWKYNLDYNQIEFDGVFMTHADADHANGLVPILENEKIKVKNFYHNGLARFRKRGNGKIVGKNPRKIVEIIDDVTTLNPAEICPEYNKLISALKVAQQKNSRIKIKHLDHTSNLRKLPKDPLDIKILGPIDIGTNNGVEYLASGGVTKVRNGNSISLMLQYGKCKILLCGDLNKKYEEEFIKFHKNISLESQVFKANHHGSQDVSNDFLEKVKPWVTVISSGDIPDYAHPRAELLGVIGKYSDKKINRPVIYATEVLRTFKPVSSKEIQEAQQRPKEYSLYERAVDGVVHIRTDGQTLVVGRVYGSPSLESAKENPVKRRNQNAYEWEYYEFKSL